MIQVEALTAGYGDKMVLRGFSMALSGGETVCLTGPSGAGKTTLLRVLAGLLPPLEGQVRCLGRPVLLFQEDRLFPGRSALEQVEGALSRRRRGEAGRFLELVELEREADKLPEELSGGMARRAALARALAVEGDILLLDEPFAGVDAARALRILERLRALGKPILMATHSPALAAACGREIRL